MNSDYPVHLAKRGRERHLLAVAEDGLRSGGADLTALVDADRDLETCLAERGFVYLAAPGLQESLAWSGAMWTAFAQSWDYLGPDRYMADGGRYRRRRHAAFAVSSQGVIRKPHQPHFQSRDYNPLNGDVQRRFEPIETDVAEGPILGAIFGACTAYFDALDKRNPDEPWHCEVHQFRIETSAAEIGRPTPEGLHRDGVDWVLVMLVDRLNVADGVTEIGDRDGMTLGSFMLAAPGDAVLLDDRRILHGVTQIHAANPKAPAHRDVLVVTWRADAPLLGAGSL